MIRENNQGNNQDKLAKPSGQGFTPAPKSDRAPQSESSQLAPVVPQSPKQGKAPGASVQDAVNRKQEAVESVVAGADNIAATVMEKARQKANAKLEPKIEELSDKMSDRLVDKELQELEKLENFFIQWSDSDRVLSPVREVIEAEMM